jgi:hypothetical protein
MVLLGSTSHATECMTLRESLNNIGCLSFLNPAAEANGTRTIVERDESAAETPKLKTSLYVERIIVYRCDTQIPDLLKIVFTTPAQTKRLPTDDQHVGPKDYDLSAHQRP